jgi:hypothetical protein
VPCEVPQLYLLMTDLSTNSLSKITNTLADLWATDTQVDPAKDTLEELSNAELELCETELFSKTYKEQIVIFY